MMKWAIPKKIYDDPEQLAKAQLVIKYAMVTVSINIGFPPVQYFVFDQPLVALLVGIFIAFIALSPLAMHLTGSVRVAGHLFIFFTIGLISTGSIFYGGFVSPPAPFLLAGPLAAVFLLGSRSGIAWAIVVCVLVSGGVALEAMGVEYPTQDSAEQELVLRYVGIVSVIAMAMVFMVQFDTVTQQALGEARIANRRIGQMITHVEATSTALSRSASEFLGDEAEHGFNNNSGNGSTGLTQQMMQTALTGRESITLVGQSLLGMIAQYRSISQRIQDLHKQSGVIAELVKTIDKISDRLDLMALNTGIEAVHAGESGKRFRLLSDDMRRLAERVSNETMRIKLVLQQVKEHTDAALDASIQGQSLTDDGTLKLEGMSVQIEEMYHLVERAAQASKRMTEDTRNQIMAIRHLARAREAIS